MRTLRIRATQVTPDQHSALVQALRASGLTPDQYTVTEDDRAPSGPGAWLAAACGLAAVGMLGAWLWTGAWQWGPSAVLALLVGMVALGLSISKGES